MAGERQEKRTSPGEKVADGLVAGHDKALDMVGQQMLRDARRTTRIIAKRIPGAPGLVYDGVQVLTAKPEDKVRKAFGVAGGWLGAAGGAGLGMLTGPAAPVAAPLGAAGGGAFGEDIGTDIYDQNKRAIDATVHQAAGAVHRAHEAWDDSYEAGQRRLEETARWMKARNTKVFGR